jgi:hypothetical protein
VFTRDAHSGRLNFLGSIHGLISLVKVIDVFLLEVVSVVCWLNTCSEILIG